MSRSRHAGLFRFLLCLILLTATGCTGRERPPGRVAGRLWIDPVVGLSVPFPAGWRIAVDPRLFRSGLEHAVLEGRRRAPDVSLVVSWHPLPTRRPASRLLASLTELDLLERLVPPVASGSIRRLERLAGCRRAVLREVVGADGRTVTQIGLRTRRGLALFQGWAEGVKAGAAVSAGDAGVVSGGTGVVSGDAGVLPVGTGVVPGDAGVVSGGTGVVSGDAGVLPVGTGVAPGGVGVPPGAGVARGSAGERRDGADGAGDAAAALLELACHAEVLP
jgi:hypothetical protein